MSIMELKDWKVYGLVLKKFYATSTPRNYEKLSKTMLIASENLKCNTSIRMHYLLSNSDWLPNNFILMSENIRKSFMKP